MANNIYRNSEGYYDPTAGAVIAKCDRKEKSDRRKAIRKANAKARKQAAAESRALVYICSPYAGNTVRNILAAQKYCRYAVEQGYLPFAAHLFFPQFLNDENPLGFPLEMCSWTNALKFGFSVRNILQE